jgi:KUP system potassium uptake protein
VARDIWKWRRGPTWALTLTFLVVDLAFLGANLVKIEEGGWFPIAAAVLVFVLMSTWKAGRSALATQLKDAGLPLDLFMGDIARRKPQRVPGTAVFLTSNTSAAPPVLLHHLKHNKILHERVLLVSLLTEEIPAVPDAERVTVADLGSGFWQVVSRYGFMESPDVPELLGSLARRRGEAAKVALVPMDTTYYLGRETLLANGPSKLSTWRKRLFIVMARNAVTASQFFGLPPNRVVEMGAQIQL